MDPSAFTLSSPAFENFGQIPRKYTCEGENVSPPLRISGVPEGSEILALIVEDPDAPDPKAPQRIWVHWVVYDVPSDTGGFEEGRRPHGREGMNDWHHAKYEGPCPPIGRHRYFFKLYALKKRIEFSKPPTKAELERAMKGNVLAETELMGTYEKGDG